jgi:hypothetical protein
MQHSRQPCGLCEKMRGVVIRYLKPTPFQKARFFAALTEQEKKAAERPSQPPPMQSAKP